MFRGGEFVAPMFQLLTVGAELLAPSASEALYFKTSPTGNRTPVSRVTGGDTHHYTIEKYVFTRSGSFTSPFLLQCKYIPDELFQIGICLRSAFVNPAVALLQLLVGRFWGK